MLFALGFLLIFLLGGISGVMVAAIPFDLQVTDSYFIVAHFHYVLNGAVVFPIFGAVYYWWPKMTGRMLNDRLGKWSFWTMFISFNVTFFPMHLLGLMGMPRRVWTYDAGLGWGTLNLIVSIGSGIFGLGTGLTLINVIWSRRHGERAGSNPWNADSLEWATSSPPPEYNFAAVPIVTSRHPLWDQPALAVGQPEGDAAARSLSIEGAQERVTSVTTGLDAWVEGGAPVPQPTAKPLVIALGLALFFVGLLVSAVLVLVLGVVVALGALAAWTWHTEADLR
jgi:heme/copper-type cytochrome/quinol oxidase subunit 1